MAKLFLMEMIDMSIQNAKDMFAVFVRFNPLIPRTRVHNAVKEFPIPLISTMIEMAIPQKLHMQCTLKYESSAANQFSQMRGICLQEEAIIQRREG